MSAAPRRTEVLGWSLAALATALAMMPGIALPLRVPGLIAAFLVIPGAVLAPHLGGGLPAFERVLVSLALSPFLSAGSAALLMLAGVPMARTAGIVGALAATLALWLAVRAARSVPAPQASGSASGSHADAAGDSRAALSVALIYAGVVLVALVGQPFLAPRSDGWFHAAVALGIAARGLPVEDPAFAGLPLLYFWGYHLWAALWLAIAPALGVWTPLIAFNAAAAAAVVLAVCALARRLGAGPGTQVLAACMAILAYAPGAWAAVAARAASGDVRGMAEVQRLMTSGVGTGLRALSEGTLHASLASFSDKYLVLTPFSMGLALFAAIVCAWLDVLERPAAASTLRLALLEAAALFLHTVVGFAVLLLAGIWGAWAVGRAVLARDARLRRGAPAVGVAFAAAGALLAPYLLSVAGGKRGGLSLDPSMPALVSWLFAGGVFVLLGMPWLWRAARTTPAAREVLVLALALTGLALAMKLPESNQSKFFNLLFLLLAPAAALGLATRTAAARVPRRQVSAVLIVACAPTVALTAWCFAAERGQEEAPSHVPSPPAQAAWRWLRAHAAPDAILTDRDGASDMMVLGARSALWGGGDVERDWGHPPDALAARRAASRELGGRGAPSSATQGLMATLGREIVIVRRAGRDVLPADGAPGVLFRNDALAFEQIEAPR